MKLHQTPAQIIVKGMTADLLQKVRDFEAPYHEWLIELYIGRASKSKIVLCSIDLRHKILVSVYGQEHCVVTNTTIPNFGEAPNIKLEVEDADKFLKFWKEAEQMRAEVRKKEAMIMSRLLSIQTLEDLQKHFPEAVPFLNTPTQQ